MITKENLIKLISVVQQASDFLPFIQEEAGRRAQMKEDLKLLLEFLKNSSKIDTGEGISETELTEKVLVQIQKDQSNWQAMKEIIKKLKPGIEIAWGLKTQKMSPISQGDGDIFEGTKKLLSLEEGKAVLWDLVKGSLPKQLETILNNPIQLGENNSNITYTTTLGLSLGFVLNPECSIGDIVIEYEKTHQALWVERSSLLSPYSFPQDQNIPLFSYTYRRNDLYWAAIPHCGYHFGGPSNLARDQIAYIDNFWPPQDCSSFVSNQFGLPRGSTRQYDAAFKALKNPSEEIPKEFKEIAEVYNQNFSLVNFESLKSGDIFNWPGHCGVIVRSLAGSESVCTLEYARSMEQGIEGCGYTQKKRAFFNEKKAFFARKKQQAQTLSEDTEVGQTKSQKEHFVEKTGERRLKINPKLKALL